MIVTESFILFMVDRKYACNFYYYFLQAPKYIVDVVWIAVYHDNTPVKAMKWNLNGFLLKFLKL